MKRISLILLAIGYSSVVLASCDMSCANEQNLCLESCEKAYGKNLPANSKIFAKTRVKENGKMVCDCYVVKNPNE